ncbi:universal stress protein [Sorangium sp. So ce1504]|uniref:universal stress protein n=1 Tax=Sorangium sp. So ce1504 TaxID=3133337 RepID=UPI003F5F9406
MQPIHRILVAADLSELSAKAVRAALEHARSWGAELRVIHVAASRQAQPGAADALLGIVAELGSDVHIVPVVRVGSAAEEIVRTASALGPAKTAAAWSSDASIWWRRQGAVRCGEPPP